MIANLSCIIVRLGSAFWLWFGFGLGVWLGLGFGLVVRGV